MVPAFLICAAAVFFIWGCLNACRAYPNPEEGMEPGTQVESFQPQSTVATTSPPPYSSVQNYGYDPAKNDSAINASQDRSQTNYNPFPY